MRILMSTLATSHPIPENALTPDTDGDQDAFEWAKHPLSFTIRAASNQGLRNSANILVQQRYAWRGYASEEGAQAHTQSTKAVLVAVDKDKVFGTLTVGFENEGFAANQIFKAEIEAIQEKGLKLCEFTSLAVDEPICSKEVLASLFHTAYIYANRLHGADAALIEVNPRHIGFYKTVLSFEQVGELKTNQKVNAPSALLMLEFSSARALLDQVQQGNRSSVSHRSYYPFFFSKNEENGIVQRLLAAHGKKIESHFLEFTNTQVVN